MGDIALIAARTGLRCIGDFRTKDVALGGQGAPLVPFVEWLLSPPGGSVWLNIGGIANITAVPELARREDVVAFDTGPGNTLIDRLVLGRSAGRLKCDRGGRLALAGSVDEKTVARILQDPYFRRKPPKSSGPEYFGAQFLSQCRLPRGLEDGCATLAALTADSIAHGIKLALNGQSPETVIASGGGTYNHAIMSRLRAKLGASAVVTSEFVGIPSDSKEAFAFAVLGFCALAGVPNNTPSATGASRAAVLGKAAEPA